MTETQKTKLLVSVEERLKSTDKRILEKIKELKVFADKLRHGQLTWYKGGEDAEVIVRGISKALEEIESLKVMADSPYFFKADVKFYDETQSKPIYISKHSLSEDRIYSWVSPIARLRYAKPGSASYTLPSGKQRSCEVLDKENYLIRQKELFNLKYEAKETPSTLVFQKKLLEAAQFGLTEIIEKLDAYQDDIIRIEPSGSLLISGPAGSGKTTLALHRMAFLRQNQQTSTLFPAKGMLIFVQDEATKNYFGSILPKLSLKGVTITTFAEWAFKKINLKQFNYSESLDHPDHNLLIYAKHQAIRRKIAPVKFKDVYDSLSSIYFDYFDEHSFAAFEQQKAEHVLDRFDLTVLLSSQMREVRKPDLKQLIVVDEAENYLPGQLSLIKQFLDPSTAALIYIGDLVQRTLPFTMRHWEQINERFAEHKKIVIPKVYRITEEIRSYLIEKGYPQELDSQLHHGPTVVETSISTTKDLIDKLQKQLSKSDPQGTTGIISNSDLIVQQLKEKLELEDNIHLLTIQEAQGVEFDSVILLFQQQTTRPAHWPTELVDELKKVERDQFLVGVTRARNELHVFSITGI